MRAAVLWITLGWLPAVAVAEDRVWYEPVPQQASPRDAAAARPWSPQAIRLARGTIRRFDHQRLEMEVQPEGATPLRIAAARIVWIEADWQTSDAAEGLEHFAQQRFEEAIPPLLRAIQARPPVWRQQILSAHLAAAAFEARRYPSALDLVSQLDRTHTPLPLLTLLPVQWTAGSLPATAREAARERLEAPQAATRLVAASWLLGGAQDAAADAVLAALAADASRPAIARLADAVRWRRTPIPQVRQAWPRWEEKLERLPIALQGGPLLTIADRLTAAGSAEAAMEYWLSAALLHQRPTPLSARARRRAAELLEEAGQSTEAARLNRFGPVPGDS